MGEIKNHNFYGFSIIGRFPEPQNQLFLSLERPEYFKKNKKIPNHYWKIVFLEILKC